MTQNKVADKAKTALKKTNGSNAVVKRNDIYTMIQHQSSGFGLALPKDWDADRFTRIAITAIKNSPALQRCDPLSVIGGLMLSAQLGLEPNSPLHEASLIPYKGKAQFQIEYRGLLKLVWNSGLVTLIDFDKICENDEWDYRKGFNAKFDHTPTLSGVRGKAIAYYAYAELKGGGKALFVMSRDEAMQHGKRFSKTYDSGPWQTDFDAMAIKTVIKQLADKKLPKRTTSESLLFHAVEKDDKTSNIKAEQLGEKIEIDELDTEEIDYTIEEEEPKNRAEQHIATILSFKSPQEVEKYQNDCKESFGQMDEDAWGKINKAILSKMKEFDG